MSTFGGFMIGVTSRLNKSIYDSFGTKEIILAQQLCKGQLCKGDAKGNILKEKHEGVNHEYKDQGSDSKTIFM